MLNNSVRHFGKNGSIEGLLFTNILEMLGVSLKRRLIKKAGQIVAGLLNKTKIELPIIRK